MSGSLSGTLSMFEPISWDFVSFSAPFQILQAQSAVRQLFKTNQNYLTPTTFLLAVDESITASQQVKITLCFIGLIDFRAGRSRVVAAYSRQRVLNSRCARTCFLYTSLYAAWSVIRYVFP